MKATIRVKNTVDHSAQHFNQSNCDVDKALEELAEYSQPESIRDAEMPSYEEENALEVRKWVMSNCWCTFISDEDNEAYDKSDTWKWK